LPDSRSANARGASWDAAGRVISKGAWTFTYGPSGQLARATRPGRQLDFVYDEGDMTRSAPSHEEKNTGNRFLQKIDRPVRN
jgi:YD repeat-containing protein